MIRRNCVSGLKEQAQRAVDRILGTAIIHFLHVGKTGGTAIKYALAPATKWNGRRILLHHHDFSLRDVPRGEKVFFFLRDPVTRFVSGFFSRQRQGAPRYKIPWSANEKIAFGRFDSPNQLALALNSSNEEERGNAIHAMRSIHHVRDSYWKWLSTQDYLELRAENILFIGLQENLAADFELLKEKLRLPAALTLPSDELMAHKTPADRDKWLENPALESLKKWYRQDYECLELCRRISKDRNLGGAILGSFLSLLHFWSEVVMPLSISLCDLADG